MCKQYVTDVHTPMRIPFTQVLYIIINNDEHSSMMIVINTVNEEICWHEIWVGSLLKTLIKGHCRLTLVVQ